MKTIEDCFDDLKTFIESRQEGVQTPIYPYTHDYYHYKDYQLESYQLGAPGANPLPLEASAPETEVPVPEAETASEGQGWNGW